MSTHIPSLSQSAPDLDTDSDYLGTPVDPPSHCQPYVAGYEPLEYYYSAGGYDSAVYPGGPQYADSAIAGASPQHGLLLQSNYPINTSRDCNQSSDSAAIAAYHIVSPNHHTPLVSSAASPTTTNTPSNAHESSFDAINHIASARRTDRSSPQSSSRVSLQYAEYEGEDADCSQKISYPTVYPKTVLRPSELALNTTASFTLTNAQSSYPSVYPSSLAGNAAYGHRGYYEEAYADSPIEDPAYGDHYPDSSCPYEQHAVYEQYEQHPEPRADTHFPSGSLHRQQNVRFYQPPSCPYSYPCIDSAGEGSDYGASPICRPSTNYVYPVIHAPRPQPVHDLYTLHSNTVPRGDSSPSLLPSHRVLSIPSVPAPPPIPRPTSLIEDSPKKPLTLACYFCRKRKIACQSPPANAQDRTCNQCAKRKLKCVYPATSRRGIRPRVYDLSDESFRRPSLPLSL